MIYIERTISITNNIASINQPVILYKGDRNVEIQFTLKNNPFKYKSGIETTHAQLIINRPYADSIFSSVTKLSNSKVSFIITDDMIDELKECGEYDFQIRLLNEEKTSRATLAPITAGIIILEPICENDDGGVYINYKAMWNTITNNNTDYQYLFHNYNGTELNLSNFDTSNVTNMSWMFSYCYSLTSLDLSNFDTSNVTNMSYMFHSCSALHTLRLDNCSSDTINKIISSSYFPTEVIDGVTRTIYCKEANASGLTAPTNWVFSYVD